MKAMSQMACIAWFGRIGGTMLWGLTQKSRGALKQSVKTPWRRHRRERLHLRRWSAARVETPEASPSQRKPEQGQYPAGIHHAGICQTKTSFWKLGRHFGVTAFPAPHYGTFSRPKGEKPPAGCFGLPIFVVNAKVKGNSYKLEAEAESSMIRWPSKHLWIMSNIQWK